MTTTKAKSAAAKAAKVKDIPSYPVVIGTKTYKLCFDLDELGKAEEALNREGHRVNMLFALDVGSMNLQSVKILFAAATRTFHPELSYEDARALVTLGSIYIVTTTMLNAFADAKEAQLDAEAAAPKVEAEGETE